MIERFDREKVLAMSAELFRAAELYEVLRQPNLAATARTWAQGYADVAERASEKPVEV